jgi:autotransporter-associated beta strand protein
MVKKILQTLLAVFSISGSLSIAQAQVSVWDGDTSTSLQINTNWVGNVLPTNTTGTIQFNTVTANLPTVQSGAVAARTYLGVDITQAGWTVGGGGNNTVVLAGGVDSTGAGTNNVTSMFQRGTGTWTVGTGNVLNVTNALNGDTTPIVIKDGDGVLQLNGTPTPTSVSFQISQGTLRLGSATTLGAGLDLGAGTTFDLNGVSTTRPNTIGVINMTGAAITTGAGTLTLGTGDAITTNASSSSSTISGTVSVVSANSRKFTVADGAAAEDLVVSATFSSTGTGVVEKAGAGTMVISSSNSATVNYTVSGGTLIIDGSTGAGAMSVINAGSVLSGTGTIAGSTTFGAGTKLSAGNSSGSASTLTLGNSLNISAAANDTAAFVFTLGTNADKILLTSNTANVLNIGTNLLSAEDFSFTAGAGFGIGQTYTLFDLSGGSATINGTFTTFTTNFGGFIADVTTLGNDIVLTNVIIPEPSTYAMLLGGLGALILLRRRSKSRQAVERAPDSIIRF